MMPWLTDSPSPIPFASGLVVKNGSNTPLRFSGAVPPPGAPAAAPPPGAPPPAPGPPPPPGGAGGDRDPPAVGHGVQPVGDQVQEHLAQLIGVGVHRWEVDPVLFLQLDVGDPGLVPEDGDDAGEQRVDVHSLQGRRALAGEVEEVPDDLAGPQRLALDYHDFVPPRIAVGGRPAQPPRAP